MNPLHLLNDAAHLAAPSRVVPVPGFAHDYERYLAAHCTPADAGRLVAVYESKTDWPSWECHPAGDELVVVLSGRARFFQQLPGGDERSVELGPFEALVNPAGVPHTADVLEPFTALYVTPCPGTTHTGRSARRG